MANEVDTIYKLDISQALAALDKIGEADARLRAEALRTGEAYKKTFSEAAVAAVDYQNKLTAAIQEQAAARAIVNEQVAVLRQLREEQRKLTEEQKNSPAAQRAQELSAELKRNQQEQAKLRQLIAESRIAAQQEAEAVQQVRTEIQQATQQQRLAAAAARDTAAAEQDAARATKQQAQQQREAAAAADKAARAAGVLGQLEQRLADLMERRAKATTRAEVRGYTQQIASVRKELDELQKTSGGGFLDGLVGKVGAAAAGFFALNNLVGAVKQGIADYGAIKGVENTFKALTGSAQEGQREVAFLRNQADRLGLELVPTAQAYTGLFAAAKEANIPVATTRDLFIGLTSASKVLGTSQQQVESSLRAVEQMASKGVVASQELKLQLTQALPGAFGLAAKAAGLTTAEFTKQLEQGKILAADFLPKLAKTLKETYAGASADAATAVTANMGRINTFLASQSAQIGALVAPVIGFFAKYVSAAETTADRAERTANAFFQSAEATRSLGRTLPELLNRYTELQSSTDSNKQKQQELRQVIDQLAAAVPGAVTQFDRYGRALGINEQAVNSYLKANRRVSEELRQVGLREGEENLKRINEELKLVEARLNSGEMVNGVNRLRGAGTVRIVGAAATQVVEQGPLLSQAESDAEYKKYAARAAELEAERQKQIKGLNELRRGQRSNTDETNNATKAEQGYIEMLRARIKANTELREKINNTPESTLNPNGGGQERRNEITKLIKADEEALRKALNEQDKGAKTRENQLLEALRALRQKRLELQKEYDRAELDALRESQEARAALELQQSQASIDRLEQELKDREAAVRKRMGGKKTSPDADGVIDGQQAQELNRLRLLAEQRFQDTLARVKREYAARSLALQQDSDAKELAELNARNAEAIRQEEKSNELLGAAIERAYKEGKPELVKALGEIKLESDKYVASLREAADEQELLLLQSQELSRIDAEEEQRKRRINAGFNDPTQTPDPTADESSLLQQNAARRLNLVQRLIKRATQVEVDAEKKKQQDILQAEIDGNNARLKATERDHSERMAKQRQRWQEENEALVKQLADLKASAGKESFSFYKLLLGEKDNNPENRQLIDEQLSSIAGSFQSALSQMVAAQAQAAQEQINIRTQNINQLEQQLLQEIALNKEGSASNIGSIRAQIAEEKAARRDAIKEKKKAQREEQLINSLSQVSNIASASAKIIEGWSSVPLVGSILGLVAVGAMIASFVTYQSKAKAAINAEGAGYFKGGYTGDGHERAESRNLGDKSYTYHHKEFVHDHELTAKYRIPLFEPLHKRRLQDIDWAHPSMRELMPDFRLPAVVREEKQRAAELRVTHQFAPMQAEFSAMKQELAEIRKHVGTTADKKDIVPVEGGYMEVDQRTRSTKRVKLSGPPA